jgi:hypothetical protein
MITPAQISDMTLEALRAARDTLDSTEWALAMDAAPADVRRNSGLLLGQVQGEILRLENLQLATIAQVLAANGPALEAAARDVKREVKKITKIAKVLKTVEQLVKLAIKVVPKAAGLMGIVRRAPQPGSIAARRAAGTTAPKPKATAKAKPKTKAKAKAKSVTRAKAGSAAKPRRKAGPSRRAR